MWYIIWYALCILYGMPMLYGMPCVYYMVCLVSTAFPVVDMESSVRIVLVVMESIVRIARLSRPCVGTYYGHMRDIHRTY